ncbi:MAG: hypothetical protein J0M24_05600 [Verrucomicrobia bacterium]|nr:hypothetical protein [Verrucomicrobiota bacterium]
MPADSLSSFALRLAEQLRHGGETFSEESTFTQTARELFAIQVERNSVLRSWCQARGVRPNPELSWRDIPAIPTNAFKEADVSCIPVPERTAEFHSSGTTTQSPSRHFHRPESLDLYAISVRAAFARRMGSAAGQRLLVSLTPPPAEAPHSSLVHMFQILGEQSRPGRTTYFGKATPSGWTIDHRRLEEFLRTLTGPILLAGTAFNYVNWLDTQPGPPIRLPTGSIILETGGYKGRSRELPRADLVDLLTKHLMVPAASILTEYGMSELSSQAYSDEAAATEAAPHLRFPPWVRTRVISPETGREVPAGQVGILQIFDLANVWSTLALQTADLARAQSGLFQLLGRASRSEPRGCSLLSLEIS